MPTLRIMINGRTLLAGAYTEAQRMPLAEALTLQWPRLCMQGRRAAVVATDDSGVTHIIASRTAEDDKGPCPYHRAGGGNG